MPVYLYRPGPLSLRVTLRTHCRRHGGSHRHATRRFVGGSRSGSGSRSSFPGGLHTVTVVAQATPNTPQQQKIARQKAETKSLSRFRTLWTMVDAGAWLGAVGTACAFVATQEALLIAGPLILPLVALYASKERSTIEAKFSQQRVERQFASAVRQLVALSEEGTAEVVEEVAVGLKALEDAKLAGQTTSGEAYLEQVRALTRSMQDKLEENDAEISTLVRRSTDAVGEGFKKLRGDIAADLRSATGEEVAALARLEGRIAGLEDAVAGLDSRQADSFRRVTASLSTLEALDRRVEEDAISEVVKEEVWRSLEPVRQLPQVLRDVGRALPDGGTSAVGELLTEEGVKKILGIELENLKKALVLEGEELVEEVQENLVVRVEGGQWGQLGARLEALDELLREVIARGDEVGEEAVREEVRGLARELREAMTAVTSLSSDLAGATASSSTLSSPSKSSDVPVLFPRQEVLRNELVQAFRALHEREYESPEAFAKELSDAVVDVLVRVLEEVGGGSSSGVPITSWIAEGEKEAVMVGNGVAETAPSANMNATPPAPPDPSGPQTVTMTERLVDDASDMEDESSTSGDATGEPVIPKIPTDDNNNSYNDENGRNDENKDRAKDTSDTIPSPSSDTSSLTAYSRGLEILKDGRKAFAAADYPAADALLAQADACFIEAMKEHRDADAGSEADRGPSKLSNDLIRAIGNRGNTLMVRARTRLMMCNDNIKAGNTIDAQDDEDKAQEMLLQAGRLYRQILELDPTQGKAFVNWGRVICLRAEISQSAEDYEGAYSLFINASDKFLAAMDALAANDGSRVSSGDAQTSSPAVAEASRLAGSALVGAYYCASALGLEDDAFDLLLEAEGLLMTGDDVGNDMEADGGNLLREVQSIIGERGG